MPTICSLRADICKTKSWLLLVAFPFPLERRGAAVCLILGYIHSFVSTELLVGTLPSAGAVEDWAEWGILSVHRKFIVMRMICSCTCLKLPKMMQGLRKSRTWWRSKTFHFPAERPCRHLTAQLTEASQAMFACSHSAEQLSRAHWERCFSWL